MKVNGYKNLTIATIFAVFLLQTIWLYNSFSLAVNKLTTEVNDFFIQSLFEELNSRFANIPPDTQIQGSINRIPNTIIMNILIMAYIIYVIRMLIFNN